MFWGHGDLQKKKSKFKKGRKRQTKEKEAGNWSCRGSGISLWDQPKQLQQIHGTKKWFWDMDLGSENSSSFSWSFEGYTENFLLFFSTNIIFHWF